MNFQVHTRYPVAEESYDHLYPMGILRDNSNDPEFCRRLHLLMDRWDFYLMDVGCAGGAFVRYMLEVIHCDAIGIDGSDHAKNQGLGEWRTIPNSLFTADFTKPLAIESPMGRTAIFDVVTLWEVFEHFLEKDLPQVMDNLRTHTRPGSLLIVSISPTSSLNMGVDLHRTQKGCDWWQSLFLQHEWHRSYHAEQFFGGHWVRPSPCNMVFVRV